MHIMITGILLSATALTQKTGTETLMPDCLGCQGHLYTPDAGVKELCSCKLI